MPHRDDSSVRRRNPWYSNLLLALSGLLIPVAIALVWFATVILDADRFVRTVTPVVDDPVIQAEISREVSRQLTAALQDVVSQPPVVGRLIRSAGGADILMAPVRPLVDSFVASDAFRTIWHDVNRVAHAEVGNLLTGKSTDGTEPSAELAVVLDDMETWLGIDPDSRIGRALGAIPADLSPTLYVIHSFEIPGARVAIDYGSQVALLLSLTAFALAAIGLRLSRNRRRSLILLGLLGVICLPVAILVRTVLTNALGDLEGTGAILAREYAGALTSSLESGLLMAAAVGGIVALLAWLWPHFDRSHAALDGPVSRSPGNR